MSTFKIINLTTDGTNATITTLASLTAVEIDKWTHIAAVRNGDNLKLLVNKAEVATGTFTGSVFDGAADVLVGQGADGVIDELRYANADKSSTLTQVATTYTYNERNQLVTETTGTTVKTYTYDNNGNNTGTETKVGTTVLATEAMIYDELNRMLSYTGPCGLESFTYCGARWHRYTVNDKTFIYDGANVLADISAGTVSSFYVTPGLDANISITQNNMTYYYTQDGFGSINTLSDTAGVVINNYDYLPYGGIHTLNTNKNIEQRYTYTGREKSELADLMYYRNRKYNTKIGRFVSRWQDQSLDASYYNYQFNRPTMLDDPWGDPDDLTLRRKNNQRDLKNQERERRAKYEERVRNEPSKEERKKMKEEEKRRRYEYENDYHTAPPNTPYDPDREARSMPIGGWRCGFCDCGSVKCGKKFALYSGYVRYKTCRFKCDKSSRMSPPIKGTAYACVWYNLPTDKDVANKLLKTGLFALPIFPPGSSMFVDMMNSL